MVLMSVSMNIVGGALQEESGLSSKDYLEGEVVQIEKSAQACRFMTTDISQSQESVDIVVAEYGKLAKYSVFKKIAGDATPIAAIAFLSPKITAHGKGGRELIIAFRCVEINAYKNIITNSSIFLPNHSSCFSEELLLWLCVFKNSKSQGMMSDLDKLKISNQYLKGIALWALTFAENSIKEARQKYGKDNINVIVCGHALGGVCAQIIGFYSHHKFYVFNAPGVKDMLETWGSNPFANLGYSSNSRSVDGLNILFENDSLGQKGDAIVQTQTLPYQEYTDQILLNSLDVITKKHIKKYVVKKIQNLTESLRTLRCRINGAIHLSRRDETARHQKLTHERSCCSRRIAQLKEEQHIECKVRHCKDNWVFHTEECKRLVACISALEEELTGLKEKLETVANLLSDIDCLPDWQRTDKQLNDKLENLRIFNQQIDGNSLSQVTDRLIHLGYDYTRVHDFDREELKKEKEIYRLLRQHSIEAMCDFIEGKMSKK